MERVATTQESLVRISLVKEEEPILLRIQNQYETIPMSYKTGRNVPLKFVFDDYCERKGFVYEEMRFLFDGKRLQQNNTPQQLEMEDDDIIDAMSDMWAGGAHLV